MNTQEAKIVIIAANQADGGCSHCASQVITDLETRLPEVPWQELNEGYHSINWWNEDILQRWLKADGQDPSVSG